MSVTVAPSILVFPAINATTNRTVVPVQLIVLPSTTEAPIAVNRTPVVRTTPNVTLLPNSVITPKPVVPPKPPTPNPIIKPNSIISKSDTAQAPYRLVPISEIPYESHTRNVISYFGNRAASFKHNSMDSIIKRNGRGELIINIDASFTQSRYFVIPNIKGLCNRLQLFAGIYVLSSYFRIPIILSKSMGWKQVWNMKEMFRGQLIEVPDRGMTFAIP